MSTFEELVGPDKKFADADALAQAKINSDNFIKQLEDEQARLREELDQRLSYEEFLDRMETRDRLPPVRKEVDNQPPTPAPRAPDTATTMTPQEVKRIVELHEMEKRYEQNRNTALSQYAAVNGPNHAQKLEQQAIDLGMSKQALLDMAAQNPKAFYRLVGVEQQPVRQQFQAPPRNQMNTDGFVPQSNSKKTLDDYEELRKSDPRTYWSPRVQNELLKLSEQELLGSN